MKLSRLLCAGLAAGSVLAASASAQCPPLNLLDPNGVKQDYLGVGVDFDGTTVVAGKLGTSFEGGVRIWRRSGGAGSPFAFEGAIDSAPGLPVQQGAAFGRHVAVDGDHMAALGLDPDVLGMFRRVVDPVTGAASWTPNGAFLLPDGLSIIGTPLALEDDLVVVGNLQSGSDGEVYYSRRVGTLWGPLKTLQSPAPEAFGGFGASVALEGNLLAVVARGEGAKGRVHVFGFNSSTGTFGHRSTLNSVASGSLGQSVAWAGVGIAPTLYVSTHTESVNGVSGAGRVRSYTEQLQPFPSPPIWVHTGTLQAGDPVSGASFGHSLSIQFPFFGSGRVVVGAPGRGAGALYVFEGSGSTLDEVRVIEGDDGGIGGNPVFANHMTHVGTTVVACHSHVDGPGGAADFDQGAIVVHELLGSTCPQECTRPRLAASDLMLLDEAGASVSIAGDTALVGVPRDDTLGIDAGAVRVYRKQGDCWYFETTMYAGDGSADDRFGTSVSIDSTGTYAIVGARFRDSNGVSNSGGAYVFFRAGSVFVETDVLEPIAPRVFGMFGTSVDIQNDTFPFAVVGEPGTGGDPGYVDRFVYDFADGGWSPDDKMASPFPGSLFLGSDFGVAVATGPGLIVIGDPGEDLVGQDNGSVYAWYRDPVFGTWSNTGQAFGVINPSGERFGTSVATDGLTVAVGAPGADFGGEPAAGRVHVFQASGGQLLPRGSSGADVPMTGAGLGRSVGLEGSFVVAGAHEPGMPRTGRAYLFQVTGNGPVFVDDFVPPGAVAFAQFGLAIDFDGDDVLVGAPFDDGVASATGSAWVFDITELPTLQTDVNVLSTSAGGIQSLALDMGPDFAFQLYWILGSASGTSPGVPLPPFVLPLNFDAYYKYTLVHANGPVLKKTLGLLDETGKAISFFKFPAGAGTLGDSYFHAALTVDPVSLTVTGISDVAEVGFLP